MNGELGTVTKASMTSVAGVGRKGTTFPPILTEKTSKRGFPPRNAKRESMKGNADTERTIRLR